MLNDFELAVLSQPFPHNKDGWQAVAYLVELFYKGKAIYRTEYKLGVGHVKINQRTRARFPRGIKENIFFGLQKGETIKSEYHDEMLEVYCALAKQQKLKPELNDVLYSLLVDSEPVIQDTGFIDWCDNFGYSSDSIKAKEMFEECQKTGLALVGAVGRANIEQLQSLFEDY